jgi:hypothetical protein
MKTETITANYPSSRAAEGIRELFLRSCGIANRTEIARNSRPAYSCGDVMGKVKERRSGQTREPPNIWFDNY